MVGLPFLSIAPYPPLEGQEEVSLAKAPSILKNVVQYYYSCHTERYLSRHLGSEGSLSVLLLEILHCVQNDKQGVSEERVYRLSLAKDPIEHPVIQSATCPDTSGAKDLLLCYYRRFLVILGMTSR